ncbi:MAG: ABC transporter permease [Firmicutes bacterium]|nr:ABC transporter permease [Bacillota bacterium]
MRAFWQLALYGVRMYLRDREAVFWGLFFPVMLMGLIGVVFGGNEDVNFTVSLVDESRGHPAAQGIRAGLEKVPVFKVTPEPREEALQALKKGDRSLVLILPAAPTPPAGAGKAATYTLTAYFDDSRPQISQAALSIVEKIVGTANLSLSGAPPVFALTAHGVSTQNLSMFDFLLPGIMAMTLMQTGLLGVSWVVASYREKLVLKRVLSTPLRASSFMGGLVARFTLVNLLQVAIIFILGTSIFKARVVGSLPVLALLSIIGSLSFLAMGFAVSTFSRTPEAANLLGSVINFPMMFLSGTFWPREMIPAAVQPLINALPLTPLVEAMRGVGASGDPLSDHVGGILYLAAWGAIAFLFSLRYFRWEK